MALSSNQNNYGMQKKLFALLVTPELDDPFEKYLNIGMVALIALNVLAVILETEKSIYEPFKPIFDGFEYFSVAIFTLEYLGRMWTITLDPKYHHPLWGRLHFAFRPMILTDLVSVMPFYLQLMIAGMPMVDLRFIRAVRLFRFFRLIKISRYSHSINRLGIVIYKKKEELVVTLFAGVIILVIASSLMYFLEHDAQPDVFSSIPSSLWWGVVTLTTVGYGDIYPKTVLGKMLSSIISLLGIGLFALPAGIIASGFATEIQDKTPEVIICPHCGEIINEDQGVKV